MDAKSVKRSIGACWLIAVAGLTFGGTFPAMSSAETEEFSKVTEAEQLVVLANTVLDFYGALPPFYRKVLEPLALDVAELRRPAMAILIDAAPKLAIAHTLGRASRVNLPGSVIAQLEVQIDAFGDSFIIDSFRVFDGQEFVHQEVTSRIVRVGDQEFIDPSVYGRRLEQRSKENLPIHGVMLDQRLAWSEDPYRLLDPVELIENQVPPGEFGIFSGNRLLILPTSEDLAAEIKDLIGREGFVGPELMDPTGDAAEDRLLDLVWTNGPQEVLWLPVDFDEAPGSRFIRNPDTEFTITQAKDWISTSSRGRSSVDVTYFPGILRLGPGALDRVNALLGRIPGEALAALAAYDLANGDTGRWLWHNWDRIAIIVDDVLTAPDGSVARGAFTSGRRPMIFYGLTSPFGMSHELGHTYTFGHPAYLTPITPDPLGPGLLEPMTWTHMGQGFFDNRSQPSGYYKLNVNWIDVAEWTDATVGGTFRIVSHDRGPNVFLRLLRIRADAGRDYWVDMRRLWPEVPRVHEGVQIYYSDPARIFTSSPGDITYVGPVAAHDALTSPFQVGDTLEDTARGVRITVLAVGEDPFILNAFFADISVERF